MSAHTSCAGRPSDHGCLCAGIGASLRRCIGRRFRRMGFLGHHCPLLRIEDGFEPVLLATPFRRHRGRMGLLPHHIATIRAGLDCSRSRKQKRRTRCGVFGESLARDRISRLPSPLVCERLASSKDVHQGAPSSSAANEQNFRHALAVCVYAPVHLLCGSVASAVPDLQIELNRWLNDVEAAPRLREV
jgi:hypothetical protein